MQKRLCALALAGVMTFTLCSCGAASGSISADGTPGGQSTQPAAGQPSAGSATITLDRAAFLPQQTPLYDTGLTPAVPAFTVEDDFSNVINFDNFYFSEDAKAMLRQNGFVVVPGWNEEFFGTYEMNRYNYTPNFVTTDAMMHTYHLYFSRLLKSVELNHFIADLTTISETMQKLSAEQAEALAGTAWENAAKRNLAFFTVGLKLLAPDAAVPDAVGDLVGQELALIESASTIADSPIMQLGSDQPPLQEDYTQYIPRGYYTTDEALSRYFKAMMWYGRLSFRQSDEDQSRSALLMTTALENSDAMQNWESIYTITSFFVGASDDAGIQEYATLVQQAYGGWPEIASLPDNAEGWQAFQTALAGLAMPAINSVPVYEDQDKETAIKGFRFMGQRFTLDADIFQQLVYQKVGENSAGENRMLPNGLDIPAAMGSTQAEKLLTEMGETDYDQYSENLEKTKTAMASLPDSTWSASLYAGWLNTLRPLTEAKGEGWPQFMQNEAWATKDLSSFLGSWAELKHDSVLYAKQVYAEMGGGGAEPMDDRGYVEPEPVLFGRLSDLSKATADGLRAYGVLESSMGEGLDKMATLAADLMTISEKELKNEPLSDADYELIRTFGGQLEHFWYDVMSQEAGANVNVTDYPAAIITDVATDPNGQVLEVGSGRVDDIYVIVNVEGSLRIAQGQVFSYYEFAQPLSERLTDKQWRQMLGIDQMNDSGEYDDSMRQDIPRPDWTSRFLSQN